MVLLLLSGWFWLPGGPGYWTAAAVLMWSIPALSGLVFALVGFPRRWRAVPGWLTDTARTVRESALITMCSLIFLLHQALISIDAIVRSVLRVFVTRRKLLEWETAAQAEAASRPKATVDLYLEWTPWIAIGIGLALWRVRPQALPFAAPLLTLWIVSRVFSSWLNRRPREGHSRLSKADMQLIRESADRIWRFFHDWSTSTTNWLIPDSVREDGSVDLRLSPTNLGNASQRAHRGRPHGRHAAGRVRVRDKANPRPDHSAAQTLGPPVQLVRHQHTPATGAAVSIHGR